MTEMLKAYMMDMGNLTKAYMMAKNLLAAEYGEAFTSMSDMDQAKATAKVISDLLGI